MPYKGWNTILVRADYKKRLVSIYEQRKHQLADRGIRSFNAFIQYLLHDLIEKLEVFSRHTPFIEKIAVTEENIVLKDNRVGRIVELVFRGRDLYCHLDEATSCVHVGYSYALPELYRLMEERDGHN
jgi:hypothetical protein